MLQSNNVLSQVHSDQSIKLFQTKYSMIITAATAASKIFSQQYMVHCMTLYCNISKLF